MDTCPVCHHLLAYHTDAACIEGAEGRLVQVAVIRCILRNLLAVPYREFATTKASHDG